MEIPTLKTIDGVLRRDRLDYQTRPEKAIRLAMRTVEDAGAHEFLTEALNLLIQAKDKVADFVELGVNEYKSADGYWMDPSVRKIKESDFEPSAPSTELALSSLMKAGLNAVEIAMRSRDQTPFERLILEWHKRIALYEAYGDPVRARSLFRCIEELEDAIKDQGL